MDIFNRGLDALVNEALLVVAIVILGIIGIAALILGAIELFAYAGQQGFVGLAAFAACWVFLSPIIATVSVLIGLYLMFRIARRALS